MCCLCFRMCFVCAGMSYQMPTNDGIIKGGGNQIFKCIPAYLMANHGKWIRELTRNPER